MVAALTSFSHESGISLNTAKLLGQHLIVTYKGAFQNALTGAQLATDFSNIGLSETKSKILVLKFQKALASLSSSSIGQTLMVNKLLLPEWRFGITIANSDIKQVGVTFMQLKLVLDRGDGECSSPKIC